MVDEQLLMSNWILNKASMQNKKPLSHKPAKPLSLPLTYYIGILGLVVMLFFIS